MGHHCDAVGQTPSEHGGVTGVVCSDAHFCAGIQNPGIQNQACLEVLEACPPCSAPPPSSRAPCGPRRPSAAAPAPPPRAPYPPPFRTAVVRFPFPSHPPETEGWELLLQVTGFRRPAIAAAAESTAARDAAVELDAWDEPNFRLIRAALDTLTKRGISAAERTRRRALVTTAMTAARTEEEASPTTDDTAPTEALLKLHAW